MGAWVVLALLVAAGAAIVLRHDAGAPTGMDVSDLIVAGCVAGLLGWLVWSLAPGFSERMARLRRDAVFWLLLALLGAGAFLYREPLVEIARRTATAGVRGPAMPPLEAGPGTERVVRIRQRPNGQFKPAARVNGADMEMLVDTGASTVVLRHSDARLAGIDVAALVYSVPVASANGTLYAAPVRLKSVAIGAVLLADVDALVAQPGLLETSLLGMSFLSRLRSYDISGEFLALRS